MRRRLTFVLPGFVAMLALAVSACGVSVKCDFGPWETLPGNDASGQAVALLHSDGSVERSLKYTIGPGRFRQPSSDDIKIIAPEDKQRVLIMFEGHQFYVSTGQPFFTDTNSDYAQMVRQSQGLSCVMQLSSAKALNDRKGI